MANGCIYQEDRANYFGKYFLWVDTWPQKYFIPPYSAGCATAMTASAAKKIYEVRDIRIERTEMRTRGLRYPYDRWHDGHKEEILELRTCFLLAFSGKKQ